MTLTGRSWRRVQSIVRVLAGLAGLVLLTELWSGSASVHAIDISQDVPSSPGSGMVSGVVTAGGSTHGVRRAIVELSRAGELNRGAITDDDGKFLIADVSTGTYLLEASKPAYLPMAYGARGPGRPGTPITLAGGQQFRDIRIPLLRGSVIAGTIRNDSGRPVQDVTVFISHGGGAAVATTKTDDLGAYRIWSLSAGTYVVGALPPEAASGETRVAARSTIDALLKSLTESVRVPSPAATDSVPRRLAYAPVFYPATTDLAQAAKITLAAEQELSGIDVSLQFVPVASIDGVVLSMNGGTETPVVLTIARKGPRLPVDGGRGVLPMLVTANEGNGAFQFTNVAPGEYTVLARSTRSLPASWAQAQVVVQGRDVSGVLLRLRPALTVSGQVRFESGAPLPAELAQLRLTLSPSPELQDATLLGIAITPLKSDGTFEFTGLIPGQYGLGARPAATPGSNRWWMRSAMMQGRDLLDETVDLAQSDLTGGAVTLSDRHTELSGTLQAPDGWPAPEFVVVVVPEDRSLWGASRRVRRTRPDSLGRFVFSDLPPGNYVLAAAGDLPEAKWTGSDLLAELAAAGARVVLNEGERKTQDIKLVRRPRVRPDRRTRATEARPRPSARTAA